MGSEQIYFAVRLICSSSNRSRSAREAGMQSRLPDHWVSRLHTIDVAISGDESDLRVPVIAKANLLV